MAEQFTFPQTGDADDAEHFASMIGQANLSDYVEQGMGFTTDFTVPEVTIATGKAFISEANDTASSTGDTILTTNTVVQLNQQTVSLTDNATNHIFIDPQFDVDDSPLYEAVTDTSNAGSTWMKIGEVDTSGNTTDETFNRDPVATFDTINGGTPLESTNLSDFDAASFGGSGGTNNQVLTTDGSSASWQDPTGTHSHTFHAGNFGSDSFQQTNGNWTEPIGSTRMLSADLDAYTGGAFNVQLENGGTSTMRVRIRNVDDGNTIAEVSSTNDNRTRIQTTTLNNLSGTGKELHNEMKQDNGQNLSMNASAIEFDL